MTDKQITIEIKNVYGVEKIYPVCRQAKLFAYIAGQKTLLAEDLACIIELGYEVIAQNRTFTPDSVATRNIKAILGEA